MACSPAPAAVGCDADTRRRRLVRDCSVTVATAVIQDDAHLDSAFVVGAGNVEGQTGIDVRPDRRPVQVKTD